MRKLRRLSWPVILGYVATFAAVFAFWSGTAFANSQPGDSWVWRVEAESPGHVGMLFSSSGGSCMEVSARIAALVRASYSDAVTHHSGCVAGDVATVGGEHEITITRLPVTSLVYTAELLYKPDAGGPGPFAFDVISSGNAARCVSGADLTAIDFGQVGAYWMVCFASVLGLYFTAYFSGQLIDLLRREMR